MGFGSRLKKKLRRVRDFHKRVITGVVTLGASEAVRKKGSTPTVSIEEPKVYGSKRVKEYAAKVRAQREQAKQEA